jgi:hypothetical protein
MNIRGVNLALTVFVLFIQLFNLFSENLLKTKL